MKKKFAIGAVILVVAAGIILGFSLFKKEKTTADLYRTDTLTKGDVEALVVTSGTINPVDIIDIGAQVSGKIISLHADYNSVVKQGQIVAELDQEILKSKVQQNEASYQSRQASLEQAKVTLENAKKKWDRTQDLFSRQLVSFQEKEDAEANYIGAKVGLQQAEASLSQQKAALDQSNVDLSYAIIRSPIDGTVITRKVNVGQTVISSMNPPVLFQVASDLTKMQVKCAVDEADIGRVKEGQKVRFSVDAFQGEVFNGDILQVRNSPTTTQNVVTYEVIINASNPENKLRPGMTATVSIITGEARGVIKIPNAALRFTPSLSKEEMDKINEELRATMQAKRQADGQGRQQAQAPTPETAQPAGQASTSQAQLPVGVRPDFSRMTPEQRQQFAQSRTRRQSSQVWILEENGKLRPVPVRTGITDNSFTALVSGDLKEGMTIILGAGSGTTTNNTQNQRGGPGGMMFMGGGRR
jgi:HlyD family secretion protein